MRMRSAPAQSATACSPLNRWQRIALYGLLAAVIIFGAVVLIRSAMLKRRMTDADVFFRAGWALRVGEDIYSVTDTNGWHYHYPPLFAVAMTPLANPPPGADATGYLPYRISVVLWYGVSVACLWLALDVLAAALAYASPEPWRFPRFSRGWWLIRAGPLLLALLPIGRTLSRGQSNMVVLLFLCGMAAFVLRNRRFAAGMSLAGAICIKIFPAFLLLHPLSRGDIRCMLGVAAGLIVGLGVIPAAALGPAKTVATYQRVGSAVLQPALGLTKDETRKIELLNTIGSVSFMSVIRNLMHPPRGSHPQPISGGIKIAHWSLAALTTAATLFIGLRRRRDDAISELLFIGALIVIMLPLLPTCFVHYFVLAIPLVVGLVADAWERHGYGRLGTGLTAMFAVTIAADVFASSMPTLPVVGWSPREMGVPLLVALVWWGASLRALHRRAHACEAA
jgi:hypothetical protein